MEGPWGLGAWEGHQKWGAGEVYAPSWALNGDIERGSKGSESFLRGMDLGWFPLGQNPALEEGLEGLGRHGRGVGKEAAGLAWAQGSLPGRGDAALGDLPYRTGPGVAQGLQLWTPGQLAAPMPPSHLPQHNWAGTLRLVGVDPWLAPSESSTPPPTLLLSVFPGGSGPQGSSLVTP